MERFFLSKIDLAAGVVPAAAGAAAQKVML